MPESTMTNEQIMSANVSQVAPKQFMPISELLRSTWETFKLSWKNILILGLILWAIFIGLGILVGGAFVGLGLSMKMGSMMAGASVATVAIAVIVVVAALVIGSVFSTALMIAVAEADTKPSIGSLISRGFKLFLPVFLTSLLVAFLAGGATFLLIIPGIVVSILTSFAIYEVVFTENRYLSAIKNSAKIVSQNFWELFVRVLVVIGIFIGLIIVEAILTAMVGHNEGASALISLLISIVQTVLSWAMIGYYYKVYSEARSMTDFNKGGSIIWMWIVAVLGWIASVFVVMAIAAAASKLGDQFETYNTDENMEMMKYVDESGEVDIDSLMDQYGQDMTEEEKTQFNLMMQHAEDAMAQDKMEAEKENSL